VPQTGGGTPLWTVGVCGASAAPRTRRDGFSSRPAPTLTYRSKPVNSFSRAGRSRVAATAAATASTTTAISRLGLVVYMAALGTADYDAMVLLDMTGFADAPSEGSSHDSGVSPAP